MGEVKSTLADRYLSRNSVYASRELLWNLTRRELSTRYRKSFLGWTWSLLNPLSTVAIYTFVFGVVFKAQAPEGSPSGIKIFAFYLLAALIPWNFFVLVTNMGQNSLLSYAGMVKKVAMERQVIVLSQVAFAFVQFCIEMTMLLAIFIIAGSPTLAWIPVTVFLMVLLGVFACGISLALSVWTVYFRDLNYLWGIVLQLWMFATPIVYDASLLNGRVPDPLMFLLTWNPIAIFVRSFRAVLYSGRGPVATDMLALILVSGFSLILGIYFFKKGSRRLAEEL
jgi:ABC-type polysaccharide/polyol phosphate export permease